MTKKKKLEPIEYAHGIVFNKDIITTVDDVDYKRHYETQFCELSECDRHLEVKIVFNKKKNRKEPESNNNYIRRKYCSIEHTQIAQCSKPRNSVASRTAKPLFIKLEPKDAAIDAFLGVGRHKAI
jgi:hypothetical protein